MSKDIIYLLTLLELRTIERQRTRQLGGGLLYAIEGFFFKKSAGIEPPKSHTENPAIDLTYARLAHLRWASRLDHRFKNYGHGVALQPHNSCEFGTWIHQVGLKKYSYIDEMQALETVHRAFHEVAAQIIRHLTNRHLRRADESYADVQNLSREIAWLLTVIEYRLTPPSAGGCAGPPKPPAPPTPRPPEIPQEEAAIATPMAQLSPIMAAAKHLIGG